MLPVLAHTAALERGLLPQKIRYSDEFLTRDSIFKIRLMELKQTSLKIHFYKVHHSPSNFASFLCNGGV